MKKILFFTLLCLMSVSTFAQAGRFKLIELPYATDALEPVISKQTIELHYGKHLQGYVNNVNKLIVGTEFENAPLEEIIQKAKGGIYDNAGQLLNHNLYFTQFAPKAGGEPTGKLAEAINAKFKSFENFKQKFEAAGAKLFGSGWVWLVKDANGVLAIKTYRNGGNPVVDKLTPILGFDVWEHAYYLDYQNRRADHLKELWKIIDWKVVEKRF